MFLFLGNRQHARLFQPAWLFGKLMILESYHPLYFFHYWNQNCFWVISGSRVSRWQSHTFRDVTILTEAENMIQTNSISSVDFCPNVNAAGKLKHTTTFVNRGKGWELKCEQVKEIEGMKKRLFWARFLSHLIQNWNCKNWKFALCSHTNMFCQNFFFVKGNFFSF